MSGESLSQKTKTGLSWSALQKFSTSGIGFAIQVLLARIIEPSEFGLLALVAIFVLIAEIVVEGGFGQALIQKKDVSRIDCSTVFWINLLISLLMYGVLFWGAGLLAIYYEQPRLEALIQVLSLSLIISAGGVVQRSILTRQLNFQKLFYISIPAVILSGILGVTMALLDFKVWSLVAYQFSNGIVSMIGLWLWADKSLTPRIEFSKSSLRQMMRFGLGELGSTLVYKTTQNVQGLLIGKFYLMDQLAFFNRARSMHRMPTVTLAGLLNRVLFPVFAKIQDEDSRILSAVRRGIPILCFALFPFLAFLMVSSESVIVVLLTEKWLPSATLMHWFPVIGMIYPLASIQYSVIRAKGRSGLIFIVGLIKNSIAIGILVATARFGLLAIVVGQVGASVFSHCVINLPMCQRVFGYRIVDQIHDTVPYLIGVTFASGVALTVGNTTGLDYSWLLLVLQGFCFAASYLVYCALFGLQGWRVVSARIRQFVSGGIRTNTAR